ncbi:spermidine/putrescine ABC transporter ATP-binding protein [Bifidobacterium dolichotidis]|uniref:ABC-type quaternary amine transporter n=1 Tax=Bifidobacterium dolichotidis TaxID=2306976 RepID=A0A430FQ06_9BIFI|nr:ABC transporter ATP-binding protein [Bifidobacterium dolichotidis]RSX54932.1 spermidine/putrescine ABC transporter ATP-binding protein [Bifidobacterium dolichotidis]
MNNFISTYFTKSLNAVDNQMTQNGIDHDFGSSIMLRGITKSYDGVTVLDDVTLDIESGELLCLVGDSGCGKTTLLRCIAGLESLDAGNIYVGGERVTDRMPNRRGISMVFQDHALFPDLTVRENVSFALRFKGLRKKARLAAADEILNLLGFSDLADAKPDALSDGQQQIVALARELVRRPRVLLLDDPLSRVDPVTRAALRRRLRTIQSQFDMTIVLVTRDQNDAFDIADRLAVMRNGTIEQVGTPYDVLEHPLTLDVAEIMAQRSNIIARPLN